mmetsp:Transcript_8550/g.16772  ORF Transcript_8550/g.16772 Transcript_8550/m.16772 type:complete len:262 (-) Transcript_8550:1809-2594(-)
MYSNMKERDFKTPFRTFNSGTLYSCIRAGSTVYGPHVSATIAIATVVHTRSCRSWTFKLFNSVAMTSWGPMALAMYPKVFTVALRIAFLWALRSSRSSKQMRSHSLGEIMSAPLSAILPTRSMQFSCTFSCLFFKIGVSLGSKSLMGGCMFCIPITFTIPFRAPRMDPSTSGYSSPRYSYKKRPKFANSVSSSHSFITPASRATRSAACCLTRAFGTLRRHLTIPPIWGRYGFTRLPRQFTMVPKPFSITDVSSLDCSWNA